LTATHRTFILLDALDECSIGPERDNLLNVIKEMITMSASYLNILVTSRKEKDISDELEQIISIKVDFRDGDVASDISLHVQKCIENDKKLRKWDLKIKQMIQNALVDGAHGMYIAFLAS
jgi:hypothetical protein